MEPTLEERQLWCAPALLANIMTRLGMLADRVTRLGDFFLIGYFWKITVIFSWKWISPKISRNFKAWFVPKGFKGCDVATCWKIGRFFSNHLVTLILCLIAFGKLPLGTMSWRQWQEKESKVDDDNKVVILFCHDRKKWMNNNLTTWRQKMKSYFPSKQGTP